MIHGVKNGQTQIDNKVLLLPDFLYTLASLCGGSLSRCSGSISLFYRLMGNRQPAFMWYTGDWLKDPELSMCEPATRGVWVDALCAMHERKQGFVRGSISQLCRVLRCNDTELQMAISDLQNTRAGEIVTHCNGDVTLRSRRKTREFKELEKNNLRVKRHRKSKPVTEMKRECNAASSYSSSSSISVSPSKSTPLPLPEAVKKMIEIFIENVPSLPKPDSKLTHQRETMLYYRYDDLDRNLDKWLAVCLRVEKSDFICGRDDTRFAAGIDWIIDEDNFTKVIEGNYDNKPAKSGRRKKDWDRAF